MQEIFNKVEQNQLQRTKNVGKFPDATETLSISAGRISSRNELWDTTHWWIRGWMIVPYMPKGQWLILCCCPIIGRGITNFLQILAILPSSLRCPSDISREGRRFFFRPFINEMEKCLMVGRLCRNPPPRPPPPPPPPPPTSLKKQPTFRDANATSFRRAGRREPWERGWRHHWFSPRNDDQARS